MSQFIKLHDPFLQMSTSCLNIIEGVFSKIIKPRTLSKETFSNLDENHKDFYLKKVKSILRHETEEANSLYKKSLQINYEATKRRLKQYGSQSSFKLQHIMQSKQAHDKSERIDTTYKNDIDVTKPKNKFAQRTIYLDRKYNRQFALKLATISEISKIEKNKAEQKSKINSKQTSPLLLRTLKSFSTQHCIEKCRQNQSKDQKNKEFLWRRVERHTDNPLLKPNEKSMGRLRKKKIHLKNT